MVIYDGLFTKIIDDLKSALEAAYTNYRFFFGPISESEFFAEDKPAVSIQLQKPVPDPNTYRGWIFDVWLLYLKYDPDYADDYDVMDDAEAIAETIDTHLTGTENVSNQRVYGDVEGIEPYRFPHEDSFVFMAHITIRYNRLEAES